MDCHVCGLLTTSQKPVPLKSIDVKLTVKGQVADVTTTFLYKNEETDPIEAVFIFPLVEKVAVYRLEAIINGRTIAAEIQEKEQAKQTYQDAVDHGRTAFLLEEDDTGDIFKCRVGNLPPDKDVMVIFSFVSELDIETDDAVHYVLPTAIVPRYTPATTEVRSIIIPTPETSKHDYIYTTDVIYDLTFTCTVLSSTGIEKITSPSTPLDVSYGDDNKNVAKVTLGSDYKFSEEINIDIYYQGKNKPHILYDRGDPIKSGIIKNDCVMLNFHPEIGEGGINDKTEFIFILDRSGSMGGTKIRDAVSALLLFLKSLPVGCYFNVVSFGSRFEKMFGESVEYTKENLASAKSQLGGIEANMGGTEILQPLKDVYQQKLKQGYSRQMFLLTDGEVSNVDQCVKLVRKNVGSTRVFTLGIGQHASTGLVNGLARAGHGKAEYVVADEKMQSKVMRLLKAACQETITDIELKWNNLPDGVSVVNVPVTCPVIFFGCSLITYAVIQGEVPEGRQLSVTLSGFVSKKRFSHELEVTAPEKIPGDCILHRLAAVAQVKELESSDDAKDDAIILLSKAANIVSSKTSFVAVDKDTKLPVKECGFQEPQQFQDFGEINCSLMMCDTGLDSYGYASASPMKCYSMAPSFKAKSTLFGGLSGLFKGKKKSKKSSAHRVGKTLCAAPPPPSSSYYPAVSRVSLPDDANKDILMELVEIQSYDGSWCWSDFHKLAKLMDLSSSAKNSNPESIDGDVWMTLLVLVYIQSKIADRKEEWEMIWQKADSWVRCRIGDDATYEKMMETAKATI